VVCAALFECLTEPKAVFDLFPGEYIVNYKMEVNVKSQYY